MNKKVLIGAAAGAAAVGCMAAAAKKGQPDQSGPKPTIWDKMREGMDEMPSDFPPRIMYDNVEATKANTEEILKLLHKDSGDRDDIEVVGSS